MFHHTHPYEPFLFPQATRLIVGTLPPPRFTTGELKEGDVDFCYGSRDGQLWKILDRIFDLDLKFETSSFAIKQRKEFLTNRRIGICDIVASATRSRIDATDLGMSNIELRDLIRVIYRYPQIETLLFTGGNSKNGPEFFFRKLIKEYDLEYRVISSNVPRLHELILPEEINIPKSRINGSAKNMKTFSGRKIQTISLTAPSGSANRAIGSMKDYQEIKNRQPEFNTFDYRVKQYSPHF